MNNKSMLNKVDSKEVLTCLLLIIVGYMTAQLFMRQINGFNVGGQSEPAFCKDRCYLGEHLYSKNKPDACGKLTKDKCNKSWYQNTTRGGAGKTPIGIGCYWNEPGKSCVTPGTGFTSDSGCSMTTCSGSGTKPGSGSGTKPGSGSGTKPGSGSGTKPTYSCNASTSKCAIDTNGSYTNASSCNADCSSWSTAYHIIAVIIWILSFICFVVGIIIAKMSFAVIGTICSVLGIIVYNGQWISDYNSSPEKSE